MYLLFTGCKLQYIHVYIDRAHERHVSLKKKNLYKKQNMYILTRRTSDPLTYIKRKTRISFFFLSFFFFSTVLSAALCLSLSSLRSPPSPRPAGADQGGGRAL